MVDHPIAACHARPQKIQDPIQLAFLTLVWVVNVVLSQPAFAASEATPTERSLIDPAFVQQAYVKASNTDARDNFGEALAIDGNTMVIGAQLEDSSANGVNGDQSNDPSDPTRFDAGAVYVFVRDELGIWSQQAYLKASNSDSEDGFGAAVSISGDTIVVGARKEDGNATGVNGNATDNSSLSAGAAYVFVRNGTTWSQQAYLKASNTEAFDSFGAAVAVSGDTLVVTAPSEDSLATGVNGDQGNGPISNPNTGAAYVFVRDEFDTWTQQAYLKASNTDLRDGFGDSVSISGDTIVVGAISEDSGDASNESDNSEAGAGAAYVFVRDGTTWTQQAYLKASSPDENDRFGGTVSISGDTIVVGAEGEASNATGINGDDSDNSMPESGAAFVFTRNGTTWSQQAYLKASNAESIFDKEEGDFFGDRFGTSVSISGDSIIVGADSEDSNATGVNGDQSDNSIFGAGAAYVFSRNGSTWSQQAYLKASNPDVQDVFGVAVSVSDDNVVVGAFLEDSSATGIDGNQDDNSASAAGAAYVFTVEEAADLVLEKTSGSFFTPPGGTINYEILVVNAGPDDVIGARVTDTPPPVLSNVTWDCMAIDGATCQEADGVDQIDQIVDLPDGGSLLYRMSGTLPMSGNNPLTNTASVSNPITELNPTDNSDSDTDLVGLFADGFESVEP